MVTYSCILSDNISEGSKNLDAGSSQRGKKQAAHTQTVQVRDLREAAYSGPERAERSPHSVWLPGGAALLPWVSQGGKEANDLRGGPAVGRRGRVNIGGTEGGGTK